MTCQWVCVYMCLLGRLAVVHSLPFDKWVYCVPEYLWVSVGVYCVCRWVCMSNQRCKCLQIGVVIPTGHCNVSRLVSVCVYSCDEYCVGVSVSVS